MTRVSVFLSVIIGSVCLSSCSLIVFEQPIPPNRASLEEIPAKFQGIWCNEDGDTLDIREHDIFENKGRRIGDDLPLVIKAKGNKLYANYQDKDFWHLGIAQLHGKSLIVYWFNPEEDELSSRINEITPLKELSDESDEMKTYLINPSSKEWKSIERKRIFSLLGIFTKQ